MTSYSIFSICFDPCYPTVCCPTQVGKIKKMRLLPIKSMCHFIHLQFHDLIISVVIIISSAAKRSEFNRGEFCSEASEDSRSGQDGQVGEAGDAHQWLVDQDGVHGLFNAILRLQGGQDQFHLLPVGGGRGRKRCRLLCFFSNVQMFRLDALESCFCCLLRLIAVR